MVLVMLLPDGTVLMHGEAPYDPKKAHEYYIRTRHLKGRKKEKVDLPESALAARSAALNRRFKAAPTATEALAARSKALNRQFKPKLKVITPEEMVAQRVAKINKGLAQLDAKLKELRAKALEQQAASKMATGKPLALAPKNKTSQAETPQSKTKTVTAAKATKTATVRKVPLKKEEPKTDPVAELEDSITQIKDRLAAALEKYQALITPARRGKGALTWE